MLQLLSLRFLSSPDVSLTTWFLTPSVYDVCFLHAVFPFPIPQAPASSHLHSCITVEPYAYFLSVALQIQHTSNQPVSAHKIFCDILLVLSCMSFSTCRLALLSTASHGKPTRKRRRYCFQLHFLSE